MILCTGDLHGTNGFKRLKQLIDYDLTYEDYLIVVGDFGVIWHNVDPSDCSDKNQEGLKWLRENINCNILFIDGNHENFDRIEQYPIEEWNGGKVHRINDQVLHLGRGELFTIDGLSFFTLGGARSVDRGLRVAHKTWWEQEVPTQEELAYALDKFNNNKNRINYVLTHEAPFDVIPLMVTPVYQEPDYIFPQFLSCLYREIREFDNFKQWVFGHYHQDRSLDSRTRVIYNDIIELR